MHFRNKCSGEKSSIESFDRNLQIAKDDEDAAEVVR